MIPVLRTSRIVLRPLVPTDAEALFAFRSDPEEQRHNDDPLTTVAQAHELIERLAADHRAVGAHHWGLTLAGEDVVVGLVGYNCWIREHRRAAVGYDLMRSLWGRGLATEAMTAVLAHGFGTMDLNRVEARTNTANAASVRMLRRLGFVQEGTFHEYFQEDGGFIDVSLFVMLRRNLPQP